jgi:hypothetical protein
VKYIEVAKLTFPVLGGAEEVYQGTTLEDIPGGQRLLKSRRSVTHGSSRLPTDSSGGGPCNALAYMSAMMYLVTISAAWRLGGPA